MSVNVDISELVADNEAAEKQLNGVEIAFRDAGYRAAAMSRREHLYKNRTGETQAKTRSATVSSGNMVSTVVDIDVDHAEYLMKGGTRYRVTSLTAMEDAVEAMQRELDYFVESIGGTK